jgi:archaeosortase B (VPXXXP-CTERM-specific)
MGRIIFRVAAVWLAEFVLYGLLDQRLNGLNRLTATVLAANLDLLGLGASVSGDTVWWLDGRQGFTIIDECTAIFGLSIYIAFLLATPASFKLRLVGLIGGALAIFVLNQIRLLLLALVQTYIPSMFTFTHEYVWQVVFILMIVTLFLFWLGRVDREARRVPR